MDLSPRAVDASLRSLSGRRPPRAGFAGVLAGLLVLLFAPGADGLDLFEKRLSLDAHLLFRPMYVEDLGASAISMAGPLFETGAGFETRWTIRKKSSLSLAWRGLFETYRGDEAWTQHARLDGRIEILPGWFLRLQPAALMQETFLDEDTYRLASVRGEILFEPAESWFSPGAGYRVRHRTYFKLPGDPFQTIQEVYVSGNVLLEKPLPFVATARVLAAEGRGAESVGSFFEAGAEFSLLGFPHEAISVYFLGSFEKRLYWTGNEIESKFLGAGVEWQALDFLAFEAGMEAAWYTGQALLDSLSLFRVFGGIRVELP